MAPLFTVDTVHYNNDCCLLFSRLAMASGRPMLIACAVIVIIVSSWSYFTTPRLQMTMPESNLPYYSFNRPEHRELVTLSGSNLSYNNFDRPKHKEWVTLSESNLSYYNFDRPKNREWVSLPESNLSIYSFDKPKNREWVEDEVMRVVAAVHRRNFTPPANETCRSRAPAAILIGGYCHWIYLFIQTKNRRFLI